MCAFDFFASLYSHGTLVFVLFTKGRKHASIHSCNVRLDALFELIKGFLASTEHSKAPDVLLIDTERYAKTSTPRMIRSRRFFRKS